MPNGFLSVFSTETSIVYYTEYIHDTLDGGTRVVSIPFDLTRVFDTIEKVFVSLKLDRLGVRGYLKIEDVMSHGLS